MLFRLQCKFVVDCRVNELYTFEEMLDINKSKMCKVKYKPRSTRLRSSINCIGSSVGKSRY